jgi:hypothetical protein
MGYNNKRRDYRVKLMLAKNKKPRRKQLNLIINNNFQI